jgi:hypothetical protein
VGALQPGANAARHLFRGLKNVRVPPAFLAQGGSELAQISRGKSCLEAHSPSALLRQMLS